jgi:hypothetical protein
VLITSVKIGVAHEYGFRQPAALTHDRGYERAQALCRNAERSYSQPQTRGDVGFRALEVGEVLPMRCAFTADNI